jgi:hypothetical protein
MKNYPNPHSPTCTWHSFAESFGAPNVKWCEETLCQFVSEPANTWSNLGYMLIAILIIYFSYSKNYSKNLKSFGPVVFTMGLGSYIYHLSNFYITQILDFVGMFLFVGWTLGMNLIRLKKISPHSLMKFVSLAVLVSCIVMHVMYINGWLMQVIILIYGFLILITELLNPKFKERTWGWFIATLATLIVAFSFSFLDHSRTWCNPLNHGWFSQGHALWHWIGSLAMYFLYKHYEQFERK